jgi:hypothetical protein
MNGQNKELTQSSLKGDSKVTLHKSGLHLVGEQTCLSTFFEMSLQ